MQTTSLEILENSELPASQARAILKVMELEMASAHETLASKADLEAAVQSLRAELVAKIAGVEGSLSRWVLTCILGQTAVLAGLGYFFFSHFVR